MSVELSAAAKAKIEKIAARYPTRQAACLPALHIAQAEFGHITDDAIDAVARALGLPAAHVFGVATFYTMFRREPGGAQTIRVCTNISCMLRGGYEVLGAFEKALGIEKGESTKEFSLVEEECIAACANAPAVLCGTRYFLDVTTDQVTDIVGYLRKNPHPEGEVV